MVATADAKRHAAQIVRRLKAAYPDAHCALDFKTPLELLVATILSAQCTDVRVNIVTKDLFRKYPDAEAFAAAQAGRTGAGDSEHRLLPQQGQEHQGLLHDIGRRARRRRCRRIWTRWSSCRASAARRPTSCWAPPSAFASGVVVDTHVTRLSQRLGLTRTHRRR